MLVNERINEKEKKMATSDEMSKGLGEYCKEQKKIEEVCKVLCKVMKVLCKVMDESMYIIRELAELFGRLARIK